MTDLGLIIQMFSYLLRRYSFLFYRGKIQNSYNTDNEIVRLFLTDLRASLIMATKLSIVQCTSTSATSTRLPTLLKAKVEAVAIPKIGDVRRTKMRLKG